MSRRSTTRVRSLIAAGSLLGAAAILATPGAGQAATAANCPSTMPSDGNGNTGYGDRGNENSGNCDDGNELTTDDKMGNEDPGVHDPSPSTP